MNKAEILDEINKTKEHLANMEKMLKESEYERWKPRHQEQYFSVDTNNKVFCHYNNKQAVTNESFEVFNCFQTKEQAEAEAEKILVRRQLEDIAKRLNKDEDFNWLDTHQDKFHIYYAFSTGDIKCGHHWRDKIAGVVYCLDENFKDIAIKEIGEERLLRYLKGE